jgi:Phage tail tube protein, GTA-gp10
MMANRYRGEISAHIDGVERTLCLTLGAVAELEDAFHASDIQELVEKIGAGHLGARQLIAIIGAGLRGGGNDISNEEVSEARFAGGIAGMAAIASSLFEAAFSTGGQGDGKPAPNPR